MHDRTRRLREILQEQRWNQAELAEFMGRRKRTIRAWCSGASVIPEHSLELLEYRLREQAVGT